MTGRAEVLDETVYVCPGCGRKPPKGAVAAGVEAPCKDSDCRVEAFRWWPEDSDSNCTDNEVQTDQ